IGGRSYWSGPSCRKPGSLGAEQIHVELHSPAVAMRAQVRERLEQAFADALAGHLDETELRDVEHLGAGLVAGKRVTEDLDDLRAVLAHLHVDEVDDDDAADVTQA